VKGNLTESPRLLREDGWRFTEDGLGASHRPSMVVNDRNQIFNLISASFRRITCLVRLRRVHPLSWRTVMAVLEILT